MDVERNFTIAVTDCLENPAPVFQPMRCKTKPKLGRYVRIFPYNQFLDTPFICT